MRLVARLAGVAALLVVFALAGCGGGSVEEGAPKGVDMTKNYSPSVEMPGMSPKAAVTAKQTPAK